jgi:fibronectin-binding autotransporter adhesin
MKVCSECVRSTCNYLFSNNLECVMKARFHHLSFVGAILLLAISQSASAQVLWNSTTGDWNAGANWVGGSVPQGNANPYSNGEAVVSNGGTATIGLSGGPTFPSSGGYNELWIGDGNTGPGGTFGTGNVNQLTGTTLYNYNWFELGRLYNYNGPVVNASSGTSSYTLNGNAAVINGFNGSQGNAEIGWGWTNGNGLSNTTGILTLNDSSTFTQNGWMVLGQADAGGAGVVNINSNAVMTVATNGGNYVTLGNHNNASGTINVSGNGQFIEGGNNNLYLAGTGVSSSGALNMSGNAAVSAWDIRVGTQGYGVVNQNGGVATVNGWLRIAEDTGSVGVYNLNGGTVNANLAFRCTEGGSGTLNIASGSVLNVAQDMTMTATFDGEASGNGVVNQNGGAVTVNGQLWIGEGGGGTAVYYMNAGVLTVKSWLAVARDGANGTMNMTAGTINCLAANNGGNLIVGAQNGTGVWNMNGGLLTNNSQIILGEGSNSGTFNLNSGTVQATAIGNNGGSSTGYLYFNGGVLQATAGNISYMATSQLNAYVQAGGAIIDTNGNNIQCNNVISTDPALIGTDGGLIKRGAGILGLTGSNSYNGPTTVNAGTLMITGSPNLAGAIEVQPGAALSTDTVVPAVTVDAGGRFAVGYTFSSGTQTGSAQPASLTTASGAVLAFKLSNTASTGTSSPGNDQINVAGNLSLANSTVINISQLLNSALSLGTYDLINAPSNTTPIGSLILTGAPVSRQSYSLSSSLTEIALDVSTGSAANLVWAGGLSANSWDLVTTKNWLNTGAGNVRDYFYSLDNVTFNDSGAANGAVVLNGALQPGSVTLTMTSAASAYSFSGTGSIIGSTGLVMNGVGSLTVNNSNNYTGETDIHGGSVVINSGGILGDASGLNATYIGGPSVGNSASVALHSGGTLSGLSISLGNATGSTGALTQNGGVLNVVNGSLAVGNSGAGTITQSGGVVNVQSGNTYLGGASGASGAYSLSGGTLNTGDLRVGANVDGIGGVGTYSQSGGVANLRNWLRLGEGTASTGVANITGGTMNVTQMARIGEMGSGTLNLGGNAVMSVGQNISIGMPIDNTSLPGSGVLNVSGNAVLNVTGEIGVGRGGGSGLMTIANNASVTAGSTIDIGDSNNNSVNPNINFGTSSGTLIQTGGTLTTTGGAQIWVGQYNLPNTNSGVYNFSGGVANLSNWLVVGNNGGTGVMNVSGNAVLQTSSEVHIGDNSTSSSGTLNVSGGVMTVNNWFVIGRFGANGVLNMTGGSIMQLTPGNNNFQNLDVAAGNGAQGTFNQSGGTVNVYGQLLVPEFGDTTTNGTYNLSGSGVLISNNWFAVGRNGGTGNFNMSGGTLVHANNNTFDIGASGLGTFTMTGGLLVDQAPATWVGENSNGTLSISAGAAHFNQIEMGVNGGATGTVALSGGLLSATQIYQGSLSSTATLRLAGGTLQAASNASPNFISGLTAAYVDSGTTTLDTNGQNITVGQPLLAGSGSGGLQKAGAGMLTLSGLAGQSTYTGPTVVSAGTLQLGGGSVVPVTHRWNFDTNGYNDAVGGVTAIPSGNASLVLSQANPERFAGLL